MKRVIPLLFLCVWALSANAQQFSLTPNPSEISAPMSDDVAAEAIFKNDSDQEMRFTWIRTIISKPSTWESAFCDPILCYLPHVNSQSFSLAAGESDTVFVHVYPEGNDPGEAEVEVKFFVEGQTDTLRGDFRLCVGLSDEECSLLSGTSDLDKGAIRVYPNPFNQWTNVELNLNKLTDVEMKVFNVIGREVKSQSFGKLNGFQKLNLNAGDLPKGAYLLQLNLNEQIVTRRLIKH